MAQRVVVLGAAGFLGKYTVEALTLDRWEVVGLDVRNDPPVDIVNSLPKFHQGDYVIHLVAHAIPNFCLTHPDLAFDLNVRGTYNVLKRAAEDGAKKVVFLSSGHVYGISPKYLPTDETHPLGFAHDIYTATKLLGERLCHLFYENYQLPFITLRLFNGYGPGQAPGYFIPDMIEKAKKDKRIVLKGAQTTKDFVYAREVAEAITYALTSNYIGELNIGSGRETSLERVARIIAKELDAFVDLDPQQPPATRMCADTNRAQKILDWKSTIGIEEGLRRIIGRTQIRENIQR